MNPDIHKGSERGHIRHNPRQLLPRLEVFHFVHMLCEREHLEFCPRVAAGLDQLITNIVQGQ